MPTDVPDWVTLTDDETVVWRGGPAPARIARDLLGEALLVVAGLALLAVDAGVVGLDLGLPAVPAVPLGLAGVGLAVVGLGVALAVASYLRFRAVEYLITSAELYRRSRRLPRGLTPGLKPTALYCLSLYGSVWGRWNVTQSCDNGVSSRSQKKSEKVLIWMKATS
jgi:hypothetical protein